MFAYITLLVGIIQAICLLQQLHYVVVFSTHRACARIAARRRFPLPDRMKPDIDMPILIVPSEEQLFSLLSGLPRCSSPRRHGDQAESPPDGQECLQREPVEARRRV